ncbi:MAG: PAS domain S-box protein [Magnetospiraceae bacterium]
MFTIGFILADSFDLATKFFETTRIGIYHSTVDGRLLRVNRAAAAQVGYASPQELIDAIQNIGQQIFVDPTERHAFIAQLLEKGRVDDFTYRIRCRDGSIKWMKESAIAVPGDEGTPSTILGSAVDVSDLMAAQEALSVEKRKYDEFFAAIPLGVYRTTPDGHQLRANPALVKLNGYDSEAEMLASVHDISKEWYVDPSRRTEFKERLERDGTVEDFESEIYRHKTRERIWIAETARVVRDAEGTTLYYEGTVQEVTSRKHSEEILRRNTALLEAMPDMIFGVDSTGRFTSFSGAKESKPLLPPEQFLGSSLEDSLPPEIAAIAREYLAITLETGDISVFEYSYTIDGKDQHFEARMAQSSPLDVLCLVRDITDRKMLEAERARQKEFVDAIFDTIPGLFVVFTPDGRFKKWSRRTEELTGYSSAEFVNMHPAEFMAEEDRKGAGRGIALAMEKGESTVELKLRRKDGVEIPYVFYARREILDGEVCLVGSALDISDLKDAEKALLESEARFRKIFERTDAIAVQGYDRDRRAIYWNKASETLFGYEASAALGQTMDDLILLDESRGAMVYAFSQWFDGGSAPPSTEVLLRRADGSPVPVFSSHVLIGDRRREPQVYCILVDLSELKRIEAQLEQAKVSAEAASKAKSEFLANMSHELRTPLNAVIGFAELMHANVFGEMPEKYQEYTELISKSGRHLLETINQILDLAKIEAGRMELDKEYLSLTGLARQVLELLQFSAVERDIQIVDAMEELPQIDGDPIRVKQALFNVIGNAVKFTKLGEVRLQTRLRETSVEIIVTDTGVGMDAKELALALEPFGRARERAYVRRLEGTGLGLSLTSQIMQLHGGTLSVTSEKFTGTSVRLRFPLPPGGSADTAL